MNAVLRPAQPNVRISEQESARRQAAIDYGRGSVRLEGLALSVEGEELNRRYVVGELSIDELIAAIKALALRQPVPAL